MGCCTTIGWIAQRWGSKCNIMWEECRLYGFWAISWNCISFRLFRLHFYRCNVCENRKVEFTFLIIVSSAKFHSSIYLTLIRAQLSAYTHHRPARMWGIFASMDGFVHIAHRTHSRCHCGICHAAHNPNLEPKNHHPRNSPIRRLNHPIVPNGLRASRTFDTPRHT